MIDRTRIATKMKGLAGSYPSGIKEGSRLATRMKKRMTELMIRTKRAEKSRRKKKWVSRTIMLMMTMIMIRLRGVQRNTPKRDEECPFGINGLGGLRKGTQRTTMINSVTAQRKLFKGE